MKFYAEWIKPWPGGGKRDRLWVCQIRNSLNLPMPSNIMSVKPRAERRSQGIETLIHRRLRPAVRAEAGRYLGRGTSTSVGAVTPGESAVGENGPKALNRQTGW